MHRKLFQYGDFTLFFGYLKKADFELSPVWCEYYEPSELKEIEVPDDWIEKNLFDNLDKFEGEANISSTGKINYSNKEFLYVLCELDLHGYSFTGCLYVIRGRVNSVSVFLEENILSFYSFELLFEDNLETLDTITKSSGFNVTGISSLKYSIEKNPLDFLPSKGEFNFSVN